jgi:hypothetical protein
VPVLEFLKQFNLGQFQFYACSDSARFERCINPFTKGAVQDRLVQASKRGAKGVGAAAFSGIRQGYDWDEKECEKCYRITGEQQYGECSTFAKAVGHILTSKAGPKPRIEIVSYPFHVFVLVGRVGGYTDKVDVTMVRGREQRKKRREVFSSDKQAEYGIMSDIQFGNDWALVDPWAGSMGYPDIVYTKVGSVLTGINHKQEFPFPTMLTPMSLEMERPAGE